MNVSDSIWDKLTRVILALLVFAGVLGIVVWYDRRAGKSTDARGEVRTGTENRPGNKTAKNLDTQLHSFENPALEKTLVERLARERLSYAKPGEFVIHFEPPAVTATR